MPTSEAELQPSGTLTLPDGRVLAWDEHGDPAAPAVLLMHGAPACRVGWPGTIQLAAQAGIRLIVPDRPGCGLSTFAPERRISDWPADMRALADHLRLERYAVLGVSGGGPYALACAFDADPRLTRTAVVAGVGPLDAPGAIGGLNEVNRGVFEISASAPGAAIPIIAAMADPPPAQPPEPGDGDGDDPTAAILARLPREDQEALARYPDLLQASNVVEAARLGPEGAAYDLWLFAQPWGFDPGAITGPVDFYAGDHDQNVPLQHAVDQAAAVPKSTLTVWPASGHLTGLIRMGEAFRRLTDTA